MRLLLLLSGLCTIGCANTLAAGYQDPQQPGAAPRLRTLPSFMLLVGKSGTVSRVPMGISARHAFDITAKLYPRNKRRRMLALKNIRSELGVATAEVPAFYLSRFQVTNEQYLRYVRATKARFPFHWWRDGVPKHYAETRTTFQKLFPNSSAADIEYWEDYWKEIPYTLPEGQERHPVRFVSFEDALGYAGWIGMRLPTEPEWTLAANAGKQREFVFGDDLPEDLLSRLGLSEPKQRGHLRPVGCMGPLARGPCGHEDMFGQVWELVIPVGFQPQNGTNVFAEEDRLLAQMVGGEALQALPGFSDEYSLVKGGSVYSLVYENWIELRVNCRSKVDSQSAIEGVGFRLAKSERPGFDMAASRLRVDRPVYLVGDQEPDYMRQVGVERYDLEAGGAVIAGYHSVSFVPLDHLGLAKRTSQRQFIESSWKRPHRLGVLITTEALERPKAGPGIYVVHYRAAGVPRSLGKALASGRRALRRLATVAKPGRFENEYWWRIARSYGYTLQQVRDEKSGELAKRVYLRSSNSRLLVSTEHDALILRDQQGRWISTLPVRRFAVRKSRTAESNTIDSASGRKTVAIGYWLPVSSSAVRRSAGERWSFDLNLELTQAWR